MILEYVLLPGRLIINELSQGKPANGILERTQYL